MQYYFKKGLNMSAIDKKICFMLYASSRLIIGKYQPLLKKHNLTYLQYLILELLWENPMISMDSLCQTLFLDSGTLSPVLKKMEKREFLSRTREINDERRVNIIITDKGNNIQKHAKDITECIIRHIDINEDEQKNIIELLKKLTHNLIKEN